MKRILLAILMLTATIGVAQQPNRPSYEKPSTSHTGRTAYVDETYATAEYSGRAEENGLYESKKRNFFAVTWSPQFRVRLEKALREGKELDIVVRGKLRYVEPRPASVSQPDQYTLYEPSVVSVTEKPMVLFEPPKAVPKKEKSDDKQTETAERKPIRLVGVALEVFGTENTSAFVLTETGLVQLEAPWSPGFRNVLRRSMQFYDGNAEVAAEAISLRRSDSWTGLALYRLTSITSVEPSPQRRSVLVTKTGKNGLLLVDNYLQAAGLVGQQVLLDGKIVYDTKGKFPVGGLSLRYFKDSRTIPINDELEPLIDEFELVSGEPIRVSARIAGRNGYLFLENVKIEQK